MTGRIEGIRKGIEGIRIGRITLAMSGIGYAVTSEEITDQAIELIKKSKETVNIFTRNPREYCNPPILKALSEAARRGVCVEIIGAIDGDKSHEDALRSLTSLEEGVIVYEVPGCRRTLDFIVVDGENVQVREPYLADQKPKGVYAGWNYKYACDVQYDFDGIRERAVRRPQS